MKCLVSGPFKYFGNFLPVEVISPSDFSVWPSIKKQKLFAWSIQEVWTLFSAVGKGFGTGEHGLQRVYGRFAEVKLIFS